jgi:hypothetical protein
MYFSMPKSLFSLILNVEKMINNLLEIVILNNQNQKKNQSVIHSGLTMVLFLNMTAFECAKFEHMI